MLHAHFMICTDDRPLKKAPNAFYAVRVDVAMNPFLFGVVDRAAPCSRGPTGGNY